MSDGRSEDEKGFQDKVLALLEWMAKTDPVRAAKLIGEYLDDLADELTPSVPQGKASART